MSKFCFVVICALLALLPGGGCSRESDKATLSISGPAGMSVTVDEQEIGKAPLTLSLSPGAYMFKFQAPGYERQWTPITLAKQEKRKLAVELPRLSAAVLISTAPAGAQLEVDGRVLGATPLVLEHVVPGNYTGQLKMPGYSERAVNWSVEDARPKRVMIDLDSNMVKVKLLSMPDKAELSINGRKVGTTPYNGELSEGKYVMRVEASGYTPVEQSIVLSRGEDFRRTFELSPLPGGISITSVPEGAEIFIDNKKRGVTPCMLTDLPPAIYDIRAEKDGFDPLTKTVEITSGYKDEIKLVMLSSTGELELDVRPAGVTVMFDGRELGKSEVNESGFDMKPIRISGLAPGRHVVTVSHPRANPESRDIPVEIEKGKLTKPKSIDVWIANCEILYKDGQKQVGALYVETEQSILFGPEPGIRYEIKKSELESIQKLKIE